MSASATFFEALIAHYDSRPGESQITERKVVPELRDAFLEEDADETLPIRYLPCGVCMGSCVVKGVVCESCEGLGEWLVPVVVLEESDVSND